MAEHAHNALALDNLAGNTRLSWSINTMDLTRQELGVGTENLLRKISMLCGGLCTYGTCFLLYVLDSPLRDVRWRAIKSIVFKLSYRVLAPRDLVRDRTFHRHLLEWFNFDEWGCESLVLNLLKQLTEVPHPP